MASFFSTQMVFKHNAFKISIWACVTSILGSLFDQIKNLLFRVLRSLLDRIKTLIWLFWDITPIIQKGVYSSFGKPLRYIFKIQN
jgi:hypothetical protein